MLSIRMRSLLAAAAVTAAVVVPAGAAQASVKAVCTFSGTTTSLTPPVGYVGGSGSFTFSSPEGLASGTNCVGEQNNSPRVLTGLGINASGTYVNTVCGTGTADGTANLTQNGSSIGSSTFHIQFAAGNGALSGTFTGAGPFTGESGGTPGYVNIAPGLANSPGVPPGGACVTQFTVHGAFLING